MHYPINNKIQRFITIGNNHCKPPKIFIVILVAFLFSVTSCKKFLDVPQVNNVSQSVIFSNEQGFKDALTGVYLNLDKPGTTGNGLYTQDLSMGLMSVLGYNYDNATTGPASTQIFIDASSYNYTGVYLKPEIAIIWQEMYNDIANINNILGQIDAKKALFTGSDYQEIKGEALGLRAFLHFDLLRMFGQSPAVGASTLAIPYVKQFGITATPQSTVNGVLDFCIGDLIQAKSLLATTDTSAVVQGTTDLFTSYTQNHFNFWATEGLLARAYLYKGVTDSASFYASAVIGSNKFPPITSNVAVAYATNRDRTFYQEQIFSLYSSNIVTYNSKYVDGTTPLKLTAADRNALFTGGGDGNATDYRYTSWYDNNANGIQVMSKFYQNGNLPYNLTGVMPLIRISEMYYIAAECANTNGDVATGVKYLNIVRQARGLAPLNPTAISAFNLTTDITYEYRKEFVGEGQTFFYFKRLNLNLNAATGMPTTLPANPYVFPLPDAELAHN
jgi:starch-binding outer membrane protein, SusD/RagB family